MSAYPSVPLGSVDIAGLGWLAGTWVGRQGEDVIEEHWSGVAGNGLMGMFRWLRAGSVFFYELLAIEQEEGTVVLRIKHFNPGLVGWEAKDEAVNFDLVALSGGEAMFLKRGGAQSLWLVYRRRGANGLEAFFAREDGQPQPGDLFEFRRLSG